MMDDNDADGFPEFFAERGGFPIAGPVLPDGKWPLKSDVVAAYRGAFGCRMDYRDTATIRLRPYLSPHIEIDGELVTIVGGSDGADGGVYLHKTDHLISSQGFPTGSAPSASTLYYAYVCNSKAGMSSSGLHTFPTIEPVNGPRLRLSATAPVSLREYIMGDGVTYNQFAAPVGQKYLGTTDHARRWRFVGWVRLDASGNFADSDTQRFVANYNNRLQKPLYRSPGYSDNNANTSFTDTTTTWHSINGGTGSKLEFISNGEDAVLVQCSATQRHSVIGTAVWIGIGISSTSTPKVMTGAESSAANISFVNATVWCEVIAEGYAYAELLALSGGSTATFFADLGRNGASADVAATHIKALVMV